MKTAIKWKYIKYLFWLGPILIIMGLSAGVVAGSWGPLPLALIMAGVIISGIWLFSEPAVLKGFLDRRSTQAGTNALAATLAVLVILGLINFLGVRYSKQVDLTENQLFTLSPQTQEVLQNLEQPVKIWVFAITPNPNDRRLLENYQRQSSQFSFEYVDPQARPGLARDFGVQQAGEVYLERGENRTFLQQIAQEPLSERRITNAVGQIASDRQPKVYFLQGHGERALEPGQGSFSQALGSLGDENFVAEPLNLAENPDIPEDTTVLVLAGPQRALLPPEVTALRNYLQRKSGLLLMLDPDTDPGLGALLQDWGISLDDRLIIDPNGQTAGVNAAVTIVTQYGVHPITEEFGDGISFYPLARPIGVTETPEVEASPLLLTGDRVQAKPIPESGELNFDPNLPPQGSLTLGVALSRPVPDEAPQAEASPSPAPSPSPEASASPTPSPSPEASASPTPSPSPEASASPDADEATEAEDDETASETRLVVIGNSSFATDGLFEQQLNGDVFLNSVNWLSQQDTQVLSIRPKEATNRRIIMTPRQQITSALTALVILPVLGFGAAILVWLRRR
ncbi:Gldg family protein [Leptolyngbya sp. FACHB-671]|uniref:GldG family protein n=1 Tax=Leptolyngbya sp. FACHB-671 TaxID=2692812 RepID=UPI001683DF13|nr:Gldg family protein [Leptolyngbya sp. FACHB-671]MBD2069239.1 Gldg family protein [Leptolyngbya sp. FACHB-671]